MSEPEDYDLVVLGSGEAGKFLAWTQAAQGKRAAVIERKYVGGSCPNIACLPSKNVIHSAKVASLLRRSAEFGLASTGGKVDMATVCSRKRIMVDGLVQMHRKKYEKSGAELIMGHGVFVRRRRRSKVTLPSGATRRLRGQAGRHQHRLTSPHRRYPGLERRRSRLTHVEALEGLRSDPRTPDCSGRGDTLHAAARLDLHASHDRRGSWGRCFRPSLPVECD